MSLIACLQFLSLTLSCRCDVFVTVQQWATQQGTTPSSSSILCSLIPSSFNICYVPFLLIAFILATFTLSPKHKKIIPMYPFSRGPSLWSTVKSLVYANRSRYHSRYVLSSPPSLLLKFFSLILFSLYAFNNYYSQMPSAVPVMHFIEDDIRKPDLKELVRMGYPPFISISLIHRSLLILPSPPVYLLLFLQAQKKTSGTAPHALFSSSYDTIYETSIGKDQQYCWFRHHFHAVPR